MPSLYETLLQINKFKYTSEFILGVSHLNGHCHLCQFICIVPVKDTFKTTIYDEL